MGMQFILRTTDRIASIFLLEEKLKVVGEITMMAWVYSPETWKGKKVHWLEKGCHFVVPKSVGRALLRYW